MSTHEAPRTDDSRCLDCGHVGPISWADDCDHCGGPVTPRTDERAGLSEVLAAHEYALGMRRGSICLCGFVPDVDPGSLATQQDYHREHIADLIADRLAAAVARAEAAEAALRWIASDAPWDGSDDPEDAMRDKARMALEATSQPAQSTNGAADESECHHDHRWGHEVRRLCDDHYEPAQVCVDCGAKREARPWAT